MTAGPRIYNLFPLCCGPLRDWGKELPRIGAMNFDWIYVNPIHRPGGSGSLYAVGDYYRYHPLLVEDGEDGDRLLADFVAAARDAGIGVMMDLVINHTANDSELTREHPEWYRREPDGSLVAPGCEEPDGTVVKWGDLAELNYDSEEVRGGLVDYWRGVVRHYVGLGVRGFRCDAAYQVPAAVWKPVIEAARAEVPECAFAAETLGCTPEQVEALRPAGFTWLFNSAAWWDFEAPFLLEQYELYRAFAPSIAFPESHDTDRLGNELEAQGLDPGAIERAYRARYLFAAAFSTGVMIPIGFEYGWRKRLHVVETRPEDREEPRFDLSGFIAEVNAMKAAAPALNEEGPQERLDGGGDGEGDEGGAQPAPTRLLRRTNDGGAWSLTLINPDREAERPAPPNGAPVDLGAGREVTPERAPADLSSPEPLVVGPGEVRVFVGPA